MPREPATYLKANPSGGGANVAQGTVPYADITCRYDDRARLLLSRNNERKNKSLKSLK
jgi:hypothetical protein